MDDKEFIKWFKSTLYGAIAKEIVVRNSREFLESEHPRDKIGRFTRKGSGQFALKATKRSVRFLKNFGKVKDPKTIAGVKKGKALGLDGKVNPNFNENSYEYQMNCQASVVAEELRRRGYNVQAAPYDEKGKTGELGSNPFRAWLNPVTGKECKGKELKLEDENDCFNYLDKNVKKGQRFCFKFASSEFDEITKSLVYTKHIVCIDRDKNGNLRLYDPQQNYIIIGHDIAQYFSEQEMIFPKESDLMPEILRVDNKKINPYFINGVVIKAD